MNVVMIIPTGIGCAIGGHSGDATPAAKLLASVCDTLILHPNVVNAADINEMPINALYVEGSMLDRFLAGEICLKRVASNRILVVCNEETPELTNVVNAAQHSAGINCSVCYLDEPLVMRGWVEDGLARGKATGVDALIQQVRLLEFDALAIYTPVEVTDGEVYMKSGGVNPYGFVEALVSRRISQAMSKPAAHAPVPDDQECYTVYPRLGAEGISGSNLFSVLKGLHKAPRISGAGLALQDVDCMVSPYGCYGKPHQLCQEAGIPIIVVRENSTSLHKPIPGVTLENYWEAAGYIAALGSGVVPCSVRVGSQTISNHK